jgi:hypothetical protein
MQRKKNIRLLISLAVIVTSTALLYIFTHATNGTSVDTTIFQIENLDKVDHLVLESPKGKTDLKFNGTQWVVNNTHEADSRMITVLFATLKQTVARRQVPANLRDSLQKEIVANGVKISCFESGTLVKEIWAGGNPLKTETYFQLSDKKPYVVTIPGYRVYVASVFELTTNDWRNKQVFRFNWQNIKNLEVVFPADPRQNFNASFRDKYFSIEGINTDTTKLDAFMDALLQLRSEKILDSAEVNNYASALALQPVMKITLLDVANREYPLLVFPREKDSNFVVGKINQEAVLINQEAFQGIFRKREHFTRH